MFDFLLHLDKVAVSLQERIGSLPVSQRTIVSFPDNPIDIAEASSEVMSYVVGSVELTQFEGGMLCRLKISLSCDGTVRKRNIIHENMILDFYELGEEQGNPPFFILGGRQLI